MFLIQERMKIHLSLLNLQQWCPVKEEEEEEVVEIVDVEDVVVVEMVNFIAHIVR